jgi:peptidoglycan/LPS O-acetylase OafA/YrhL
MRAIAVLSVLIFHAFPDALKGGFVGVDIFFVISGFLISGILLNNLQQGRFSILDFYVRRIKRIFPALILVMLTCFVAGWFILLAEELRQLGKHMAAGAGFVSNIALWGEAGYFDTSADTKPLLHLWSLGVEEQFYLLWPLLLWAIWRRRGALPWVIALVALLSFGWNIATVHHDGVAAFYLPMSRFWELASGALLAYLSFRQPRFRLPAADTCSVIGLLLIAAAIGFVTKDDAFPGWWAVLPVMGAWLMLAAGPQASVNRILLSNRVLVWFGLISYPLYLWHWPLLAFARLVIGQTPSVEIRTAVVLLSIVLAWLTYRVVERPIRLAANGARIAFGLALVMVVVAYLGYYTVQRNGMEFRDMGRVTRLFNADVAQVSVLNRFELPHPSCAEFVGVEHSRDWCTDAVAPSQRPAFLLIGDSFSGAYAPMFARLYQIQPGPERVYRQFARGACPSLLGYGVDYCREISDKIADYVKRTPSIKTVVLAANWPGYYVADGDEFSTALTRTVDFYRQLGKRVVVLLSPPNGANPKACVMRAVRLSDANFCDLPLTRAEAMDEHYRDKLLPQLQQLNVPTFDPYPYLCEGGDCKVIDGPRILYYDAGHLSAFGAEFLATRAELELLALVGGPR